MIVETPLDYATHLGNVRFGSHTKAVHNCSKRIKDYLSVF